MQIVRNNQKGFTLVEMLVAVALFGIVMLVAVGTLLSLVTASHKAQALQSVINNLNITIDSMSRNIRQGTNYHCGSSGDPRTTLDCPPPGADAFSFLPYSNGAVPPPTTMYCFVGGSGGGYIARLTDGSSSCDQTDLTFARLTAPEVSITSMTFYVFGSTTGGGGDMNQPEVVMVIKGTARVGGTNIATTFHIQTTDVQRVLDI